MQGANKKPSPAKADLADLFQSFIDEPSWEEQREQSAGTSQVSPELSVAAASSSGSADQPSPSAASQPSFSRKSKADAQRENNVNSQRLWRQRKKERQEEQEAHVRYLQARLREAQEGLAAAARRHATLEELAGQQVNIDSVSSGLGQTDHLMACLRAASAGAEMEAPDGFFALEHFDGRQRGRGFQINHLYNAPVRLTHAEAQSQTGEEVHDMYLRMVRRSGVLLLQSGEDPESPAGRALHALVQEFRKHCAYMAMYNPRSLWRAKAGRMAYPDTGAAGLMALLPKLALKEEQEAWMLAARARYWTEMGRHLTRRSELQAILAGLDVSFSESLPEMAERHVAWSCCAQGLQATLNDAHASFCVMQVSRWAPKVGYNQFQEAKQCLQAYPNRPGPHALVEVIAKVRGEPGPEELFNRGARGMMENAVREFAGNGGVDTEVLAAAMSSLHLGLQEKLWDSMRKSRLLKWVVV